MVVCEGDEQGFVSAKMSARRGGAGLFIPIFQSLEKCVEGNVIGPHWMLLTVFFLKYLENRGCFNKGFGRQWIVMGFVLKNVKVIVAVHVLQGRNVPWCVFSLCKVFAIPL